jgi:hypothetical protein
MQVQNVVQGKTVSARQARSETHQSVEELERISWIRCDQCEQWRKTDRKYEEDDQFSCCNLYEWVANEDGSWAGSCNTSADFFHAFDKKKLDDDLTFDFVCECVENLLHKLPKEALTLQVKWNIIDEPKSITSHESLMDKVRSSFC